jgi:hypothetical protein
MTVLHQLAEDASATMRDVDIIHDDCVDDCWYCDTNENEFFHVDDTENDENNPFDSGIQVHLIWDTLEESSFVKIQQMNNHNCETCLCASEDDETTLGPSLSEEKAAADDESMALTVEVVSLNDNGDTTCPFVVTQAQDMDVVESDSNSFLDASNQRCVDR